MGLFKTAITSAALLAGGTLAMTPENADAQVRVQIGGNGYRGGYSDYGYGNGHSYGRSGFRSSNYGGFGSRYGGYSHGGYGGGYGYGGGWRDRGHYDYHPTTVVPHRGHYHVQPGHYDYHNGGHRH